MNTPDTEWSEQIIDLGVQVNTVQDGDASYREYTFNDAQLEAFTSSRDTYWKEREKDAYQQGQRQGEINVISHAISEMGLPFTREYNLK